MIRILARSEPSSFDQAVRKKGQRFLAKNPAPTNWVGHSYWREAIPDLIDLYDGICAYCCHWIPPEQGSATVDHFIPKSVSPNSAYEWSNFRLATSKMNSRKWTYTDVVDPFQLQPEAFILLFPAMLIRPNPSLTQAEQKPLWDSINRLNLNYDKILVNARLSWVLNYCDGHISFAHLKRHAPFIAAEIERQQLHTKLSTMFAKRKISQGPN